MSLLQSSLQTRRLHSMQLISSAASLSALCGLGLMLSLMEGFRRAYRLPRDDWGFWQRRFRALMLVPIALVPLLAGHAGGGLRPPDRSLDDSQRRPRIAHLVLFFWRMVRWAIALATSVAVLGASITSAHGARSTGMWVSRAPGRYAALVPGYAGLRLVCHARSLTTPCSTALRRRHRYAGLALHHRIQRPAWSGIERRPLPRAPGANLRLRWP